MIKRVSYTIFALLIIVALAFAVVSYSRGYRLNFNQKKLTGTGILSVSSYPEKSSVFLDGKLLSATNSSLSLSPSWYDLRVSREGYQSWEKKVRIQAEIVSQIDALLIPSNPSLRAVTTPGILYPKISPGSMKLAYIVPQNEATTAASLTIKTGIWVLDLRDGTLGARSQPKQIFQTNSAYQWQETTLIWSPDEKQIIAKFAEIDQKSKKENVYLSLSFSTDNNQTVGTDVTLALPSILKAWDMETQEKLALQLAAVKPAIAETLKEKSARITFSPDESKIFYQATGAASLKQAITPPILGSNPTDEKRNIEADNYYAYDTKEDKNFLISDTKNYPDPSMLLWYTDSKHIITIEKDTISIRDYDGTNKRTIYSGPFEEGVVFPWASGGRLLIMTTLNKPQALPNLYEIDLR